MSLGVLVLVSICRYLLILAGCSISQLCYATSCCIEAECQVVHGTDYDRADRLAVRNQVGAPTMIRTWSIRESAECIPYGRMLWQALLYVIGTQHLVEYSICELGASILSYWILAASLTSQKMQKWAILCRVAGGIHQEQGWIHFWQRGWSHIMSDLSEETGKAIWAWRVSCDSL